MRTPDSRFYCPQIDVGEFSLDENESSHAIRVCRATVGDILQLSDGNGRFADATIVKADPKACTVRIDSFETVSTQRPLLNLAIACLKDDALEEVVFHAAQTEIDTIYFLRTDFSQEPKNSDLHKLVHRAELKSLVGLKQSRKPWLTRIVGPVEFDKWLASFGGDLILCDIDGKKEVPVLERQTALLIGPEGGFSPREIEAIKNYNQGKSTPISLGKTRLRARTAAVVALGKFF